MLFNFIVWFIVVYYAACMGFAFHRIWSRITEKNDKISFDQTILMGMCILTVYAQTFSIFYGVGLAANSILFFMIFLISFLVRKDIRESVGRIKVYPRRMLVFSAFILLLFLILGSSLDNNHDTGLYHAQSIRWIEEYGVVKGLGCLHHRLAYNSSFLALQALFGCRYVFGVELHSLNALLAFIMLVWSVTTLKCLHNKQFWVSDIIKLLIPFQICVMLWVISSPGTDFFAVELVIYVVVKWIELVESGCRDEEPYIYLCFLAVYCVTLKLSTAVIISLVFWPVYLLFKKRRYLVMTVSFLIGLGIAIPYLIRNVIISGYLLYPLPELDLFQVDWKMPFYQVIADKKEIIEWARETYETHADKIKDWVPIWYEKIGIIWQMIFILMLISIGMSIIYSYYFIKSDRERDEKVCYVIIYAGILILLAYWFFTAPAVRFGGVFMLFLPAAIAGRIMQKLSVDNRYRKTGILLIYTVILAVSLRIGYHVIIADKHLIAPAPYREYEVEPFEWESIVFYCPAEEDDRTGYDYFPQLTYKGRTSIIELRGGTGILKEGFRMRNVEEKRCVY